jgi:leucine dehydrogenase
MLLNKIKAKIIAGAANNQLANEDVHGAILQERGILYAQIFLQVVSLMFMLN